MSLLLSAALVALVVLAGVLAWPAMYAVWSRATVDTEELNFWRLLRRRGVTLASLAGRDADLRRATARCIGCRDAARCDEALEAGRVAEIAEFCPNRHLIDDMVVRQRDPQA